MPNKSPLSSSLPISEDSSGASPLLPSPHEVFQRLSVADPEFPERTLRADGSVGTPDYPAQHRNGLAAVRSQADRLGDVASLATAVSFDLAEDVARQEFKDDADVNVILRRFGVPVPQQLPYGVADMSLDYFGAVNAVRDVNAAMARLPQSVIDRYGSVQAVFDAIAAGTFSLEEPKDDKAPPAPAPVPAPAPAPGAANPPA